MKSEDDLVDWLRRKSPLIGDDAAILKDDTAVTVDSHVEAVHFPRDLDAALLARRLLAVNLSDLAAMGARPTYAFIALAAPKGFAHQCFFTALLEATRAFGIELAGGDLARHHSVVVSMTLCGSKQPDGRWLRRSGAQPGDRLWVGGTLGEAALGQLLAARGYRLEATADPLEIVTEVPRKLRQKAWKALRRHFLPTPQLELGGWLATQARGAAIDVSDGLAIDLHRLCRASQVGAEIDLERLPFTESFHLLARHLDASPQRLAVQGGEDYVLLFTLPADARPPDPRCRQIGGITKDLSILQKQGEGIGDPLPAVGWDHLKG